MYYPLELAGFGRRAVAKGIDWVIVYSLTFVFMTAWGEYAERAPASLKGWLLLSPYLFMIGYNAGFLERFGATPGKMVLGIQVVKAGGEQIGGGRAFGRALAEFLSITCCYIGYFFAVTDNENRTWHDSICNTRVVRKR